MSKDFYIFKTRKIKEDEFDDAMLYIKRLNIPTDNKIELMEILKDYGKNNLRVKKDKIDELFRELSFQKAKSARRDVKNYYIDLSENIFLMVYGFGIDSDFYYNDEVFSEIVLRNNKKSTNKDFCNYQTISPKKTIDLVCETLHLMSKEYEEWFIEKYVCSDGMLFFTPESNPEFIHPDGQSMENCSIHFDSEGIINIASTNSLYDVSALIHEFIHETNTNDDVICDTSNYFTESTAHYSELFFYETLRKKYPEYKNDFDALIKQRFYDVHSNAAFVKILSYFARVIENGRYIDRGNIKEITDIINKLSNDTLDSDDVDNYLAGLSNHFEEHLSLSHQYSKAFVISSLIHDMCEKKGISAFTDLNSSMFKYPIACVYDELGILQGPNDKEVELSEEDVYNISTSVVFEL